MPCIALPIDFKTRSGFGPGRQLHRSMFAVNGTRFLTVHIDKHLRPRSQMHQDTLPRRLLRHGHTGPKPPVLPFLPPFPSHRKRLKLPDSRLLQGQMFHGGKTGKLRLPQFPVQIPLKGLIPYLQPLVPLPSKLHALPPCVEILCHSARPFSCRTGKYPPASGIPTCFDPA